MSDGTDSASIFHVYYHHPRRNVLRRCTRCRATGLQPVNLTHGWLLTCLPISSHRRYWNSSCRSCPFYRHCRPCRRRRSPVCPWQPHPARNGCPRQQLRHHCSIGNQRLRFPCSSELRRQFPGRCSDIHPGRHYRYRDYRPRPFRLSHRPYRHEWLLPGFRYRDCRPAQPKRCRIGP